MTAALIGDSRLCRGRARGLRPGFAGQPAQRPGPPAAERLASEARPRNAIRKKNSPCCATSMLSRIPALDNLLRRSERVSNIQTMLAQAGMRCAPATFWSCARSSVAVGAIVSYILEQAGGSGLGGAAGGRWCCLTRMLRISETSASRNSRNSSPRPSTRWRARSVPDTPSPPRSN